MHLLFDHINLCFDELLSDLLHNNFFAALLRYFRLYSAAFSTNAVPCACAACETNQQPDITTVKLIVMLNYKQPRKNSSFH